MWLLGTIPRLAAYFLHGLFGFGPCCRFEPTCSQYASLALEKHGIVRGCIIAVRRIFRCCPGGQWGMDPVPDRFFPR